MIVIQQSFVLAPGAVPLNTPIFGWNSLVTAANVSASSVDAAFPASNLANPSTALRWQAALIGSPLAIPPSDIFITAAINSIEPVDYAAIAVHNLGSGGNIVSVEGDTGGSPTWNELVGEQILPNDEPVIFRFSPQSLSSLRLRIQPGSELPFIAVLYVGKLLVMERGTHGDHVPINLGRTSKTMNAKSESGHFLGRIVLNESRATSIPFQRVTDTFYRNEMDEFIVASKEDPFFFAWKPQEFPQDVGYCCMTNDPQPSKHFETGTVSISLSMNGVAV